VKEVSRLPLIHTKRKRQTTFSAGIDSES